MKLSNSLLNKHENCPIGVVRDYTPKKSKYKLFYLDGMPSGKIALVCKCHNKWIKWLSEKEASEIESLLGQQQ